MILINLLTPESIKKEERAEFLVIGYVLIGITVALCLVSGLIKYSNLSRINKSLAVATSELTRYESIVKQVEALEATRKVLETKKNVIDSLLNGGLIYPMLLDDVIALLPAGISFKSLNAQMGAEARVAITLTAEAVNNYVIADFVSAVAKQPDFSDVELGAVITQATEKSKISAFTLTAKYLKKKS